MRALSGADSPGHSSCFQGDQRQVLAVFSTIRAPISAWAELRRNGQREASDDRIPLTNLALSEFEPLFRRFKRELEVQVLLQVLPKSDHFNLRSPAAVVEKVQVFSVLVLDDK